MNNKYIFVIDTEQYAGNFKREMTAYITGHVGDCGVGENMIPLYQKETGDTNCEKFGDILDYRPDDHGCCRPCAIYPTPGWFNPGMASDFRDGEDAAALKEYVKRCEQIYGEEFMTRTLYIKAVLEKGEECPGWSMEAVEREIKRLNENIEAARRLKKPNHCPSYLSVAIYFEKKPSQELIDLMKKRAYAYSLLFRQKEIKITGFRLIEETTSSAEEAV